MDPVSSAAFNGGVIPARQVDVLVYHREGNQEDNQGTLICIDDWHESHNHRVLETCEEKHCISFFIEPRLMAHVGQSPSANPEPPELHTL